MVREPRHSPARQYEQPYLPGYRAPAGHGAETPSFHRPAERHREKRLAGSGVSYPAAPVQHHALRITEGAGENSAAVNLAGVVTGKRMSPSLIPRVEKIAIMLPESSVD
ncbi:hypothetical protein Dda3937_04520 [Dickeya dadantii 3937]|uniref:Uncharacterized protein n=1 Tax=Dickeya dadantii (strain 3937) TaxID=198628 RepID=E0SHJ0_DICD3|nr:hypothetical protein Dda3937_04520 [Dickeya dadantii 3937]